MKPPSWLFKHFNGCVAAHAKHESARLGSATTFAPGSGGGDCGEGGDDDAGVLTATTGLPEALSDYFRKMLGARALVDEYVASFNLSWEAHVGDPRVTLIQKLLDKKVHRSTRAVMLFMLAQLHRALDDSAELFGEKQGDDDPYRPAAVSLHHALHAFHSVCVHSPLYKIGIDCIITYSSTAHQVGGVASPLGPASNSPVSFGRPGGAHHQHAALPSFGFFATVESRQLPLDSPARRMLRCRVLQLGMLLEKGLVLARGGGGGGGGAVGESGAFDSSVTAYPSFSGGGGAKADASVLAAPGTYRAVLGEIADCCGAGAAGDATAAGSANFSFAQKFGSLLQRSATT